MPRATCRCGQTLTFPLGVESRIVCPRCGAKVRIRFVGPTPSSSAIVGDGYLRFHCPCGRRLKVSAENPPEHGQCPDCGRVVPVPRDSLIGPDPRHPETPTEDLIPTDRERLEAWVRSHRERERERERAQAGVDPEALTEAETAALFVNHPETFSPGTLSTAEGPIVPLTEIGLRLCPRCGKPLHLAATTCRHCGEAVPR